MTNTPSLLITLGSILFFHGSVDLKRGVLAQGVKHYCSRNSADQAVEIKGEIEGDIYTLYPGDSHYQNNQNCVWMIDAGANNRIEITVVSSNLQWAHETAICPGYDHVAIKDGANGGKESILLQWCGIAEPLGAVSSGRYIRVEFMSDKQNPYQYTGVHLRFKTFLSSECAPTWSNSSGGFCYKLLNKDTDWSSAQRECNTGGANLASVQSQKEHDFLVQTFGSSANTAWIGLNDIVYPADYQWIDQTPFSYSRFVKNHAANKFFRCVTLVFAKGSWRLKDCEKGISKPLCKSRSGSKPVIFPIPQPRPDETDPATPIGRVAAIAISVFVLVTILIIGCVIYRRRKSQHQKSAYESRKRPAVALHEISQETRQPSAPPEEHTEEPVMINPDSRMLAPPTYDEALNHPVVPSPQS